MKNPMLTTIAATAALALSACNSADGPVAMEDNAAIAMENAADEPADGNVANAVDTAFVTEAMQGDNGEVAIGQLAQIQGVIQKVKDFGKMLADDHGAHKAELVALAETARVPVTDEFSAEAKANLDKLKALRGAEFDAQFKSMMVEDHVKDIAKYEKQAASGDAQTAALAKKTLPTLRKHLDTANAL